MSVYFIFLRIQSDCGKMRTIITPNTDTFHAVKRVELAKLSVRNVSHRAILTNLWKVYDEAFMLNADSLRRRNRLVGINKPSLYKLLSIFHYGGFYYQNWQIKNLYIMGRDNPENRFLWPTFVNLLNYLSFSNDCCPKKFWKLPEFLPWNSRSNLVSLSFKSSVFHRALDSL